MAKEATIEELLKLLGVKKDVTPITLSNLHEANSEQRRELLYSLLEQAAAVGDRKIAEQCVMAIEITERWVPLRQTLKVVEGDHERRSK